MNLDLTLEFESLRFEFRTRLIQLFPHSPRRTDIELLSGVPIERVAILLGHSSVRITEKQYAPWVRTRQDQLGADLTKAWSRDAFPDFSNTGYTAGTR
jgi:integrase